MIHDVLNGCIIGFASAAYIGPICILCIQRTLISGFFSGAITGLGCAVAEMLLGVLAGFSISSLNQVLADYQIQFQIVSGLFLCYVGYRIARQVPVVRSPKKPMPTNLFNHYSSTFLLAIANPLPTFVLFALFINTKSTDLAHVWQPLVIGLGIFLGEMLWWLPLSGACHQLRSKFPQFKLHWLNRFSGSAIACFGFILIGRSIVL